MSTVENHIRRPWIAVLLSLLSTGLGHIYCGRFVKGLVLYVIPVSLMPIVAVGALVGVNTIVLLVIAAAYGAVSVVCLYAVFDSYRVARQCARPYVLRDYNNPIVYLLLLLLQIPFSIAMAFQFRAHVMEAFVCPARSMEPNIRVGDRFLVNKTSYASRSPERGEIVVFKSPANRRQNWIKRVIAIPGDTIAIQNNEVLLNGQPLAREPVGNSEEELHGFVSSGEMMWEMNGNVRYAVQLGLKPEGTGDVEEMRVPPGTVFVLGDNRDMSRDSRQIGLIPESDVVGEVQFLYWPARSWSRFGGMK